MGYCRQLAGDTGGGKEPHQVAARWDAELLCNGVALGGGRACLEQQGCMVRCLFSDG